MTDVNIGNGRFMMGDCLERMRELPDASVDMILCDLPYGTTQNKWDAVIPFEPLWAEYWRVCKPNAAVVLTAAQPFTSALVMSQPREFKYDWTWRKQIGRGHLNAKKMPLKDKEDVCVFYRQQCTYNPQMTFGKPYSAKEKGAFRESKKTTENYGAFSNENRADNGGVRYPKQVLDFNSVERGIHPTQKPVSLFEYMIRTYTDEGMTVLDNCAGSGTTAIAAERTGRSWICIERDPEYYARACERVQTEIESRGLFA